MDPLTQMVLDFQSGRVSGRQVERQILELVFQVGQGFSFRDEEDGAEFLVLVQPLFLKLMERFQYQGVPFRHYLLRSLRWQWVNFRSQKLVKERHDRVLISLNDMYEPETDTWDQTLEVHEETVSIWDWLEVLPQDLDATTSKRLIWLALKAEPFLSDQQTEELCRRTGTELSWMQACQYRLRKMMLEKQKRRQRLCQKRRDIWCKRIYFEKEAQDEFDPDKRQLYQSRAQIYRQRLVNLQKEITSCSISPSHQDLAQLLDLPKGTIDSGLYHLKKALKSVYISDHETFAGYQQSS